MLIPIDHEGNLRMVTISTLDILATTLIMIRDLERLIYRPIHGTNF